MKREFKRQIIDLLDQHRIMTIATNRPDGGIEDESPPGESARMKGTSPLRFGEDPATANSGR